MYVSKQPQPNQLYPRALSTLVSGVWGGCREGPVIPNLRRYHWSPRNREESSNDPCLSNVYPNFSLCNCYFNDLSPKVVQVLMDYHHSLTTQIEARWKARSKALGACASIA